MDCNGSEVVVFDEVMIAEGSKRWEMTVCCYFVGYNISVNELRYNLRRMWGRHGFKEIINFNNGIYFIKFHHNEGLIMLLTMGLGCRVGKLMVMDHITATLCNEGVGRFRFVRVMVKVSTSKHLPSEIEMVYKCGKRNVEGATTTTNKNVNVESNMGVGDKQSDLKVDSEGFTAVQNKKGRVVTEKVLRPNFKPNTQQPKGVASTKGVMSEKANPQFTYQPKKKDGGSSNIPPDKLELNENDKLKRPVDSKEKSPNKKA
ncbi:hypothetical protein Tco_1260872 [Tanacetum coccineum]